VLGLAVITLYAVAGWDPLVQLFFWGGTGGGYGVLLLIALTSIAVIAYFARHPVLDGPWRRIIAPVMAAAALAAVAWLATTHFHTLLGVTRTQRSAGSSRPHTPPRCCSASAGR
jgi:hypothetical protein